MLVVASAWADPTPSELQAARELFAKAQKDEEANEWSSALEKLRRVASVKMTPGVRLHIAVCEEKLGQLVAAFADYSAAESLAKSQSNGEVLQAVAEPLVRMKARVPMLTISVPSDASNLEVSLDGKKLAPGVLGVAMPVDPGAHKIEAKASGKKPFTALTTAREHDSVTIDVRFDSTAAPPPPRDEPKRDERDEPKHDEPRATPATPTATKPDLHDAPPPEEDRATKTGSVLPAVLTAAGAVGLGIFGIGAFVAADGAYGDLKQACSTALACPSDKRDGVRTWDAVALTSWIGAGALATVSVVLFVARASSRSEAAARLTITPTGAFVRGAF